MILVLLGAPGAGKGTQAKFLSEKLNLMHISTGDILRDELKKGTELGKKASQYMQKGELVPDEIIVEMIKNIMSDPKSQNSKNGFLMDGFPRTLNQAQKFDEMLLSLNLGINKVVNIDVKKEELIKRLSSRRVCHSCNNICSLNDQKNGGLIEEGKCPVCGGQLYQRKDDEERVIMQRLEVYETQTRPLIDYYAEKGVLVNIDGMGSEEKIAERIVSTL